jgi:hypothetical protein
MIYLALPPAASNAGVQCTEDCSEVYNWESMLTPDEAAKLAEGDLQAFSNYIWEKIKANDERA